jgi:hypothetical protein
MTCIVGAVVGGVVAIGGDSMANASCPYDLIASPKVVRVGHLIIGVSGSPRVTNVAHYCFEPSDIDGDPMRWMVRTFVPHLMAVFRDNQVPLEPKENQDWAMLVSAGGRLFAVYDDWQVEETAYGFAAVGCGSRPALGALHAIPRIGAQLGARESVEIALRAAEASDTHVRGPFTILESPS